MKEKAHKERRGRKPAAAARHLMRIGLAKDKTFEVPAEDAARYRSAALYMGWVIRGWQELDKYVFRVVGRKATT